MPTGRNPTTRATPNTLLTHGAGTTTGLGPQWLKTLCSELAGCVSDGMCFWFYDRRHQMEQNTRLTTTPICICICILRQHSAARQVTLHNTGFLHERGHTVEHTDTHSHIGYKISASRSLPILLFFSYNSNHDKINQVTLFNIQLYTEGE